MIRRDNARRDNERTVGDRCRFCREGIHTVDYKDLERLSKLITSQGRMFSRKRSGNCARHQRSFKRALKRARIIGLLHYV